MFPRDELIEYLRQEILRRYRRRAAGGRCVSGPLDEISAGGRRPAPANATPAEPHRVLAGLPLPIYITTNRTTCSPMP